MDGKENLSLSFFRRVDHKFCDDLPEPCSLTEQLSGILYLTGVRVKNRELPME